MPERLRVESEREVLSYLAGFFDGEGTIYIQRVTTRGYLHYKLMVSVRQNDPAPILMFKNRYGGTYGVHRGSGQWGWQAGARIADKFLREIEPFLIVKKSQALLGMSFQDRRERTGRGKKDKSLDHADYIKMKELKKEKPWLSV